MRRSCVWRAKQNNSLCHPQENEKFNNDNKCQQVYKSLFLDKNTFFPKKNCGINAGYALAFGDTIVPSDAALLKQFPRSYGR